MQRFFYPRSIAVVGASAREDNLGKNIVSNMDAYGFKGPLYPVSPKGGTLGSRQIFKSLSDLPEKPDLVVVFTPAKIVPSVLEECGKLGIDRAVVESGGFSELSGQKGVGLEAEVARIADRHGIRFIGPNCIGVVCTESGVATPFPLIQSKVKEGGLSIIAQSGGVALTYMNEASNIGMGVSKVISVGNKLNVNEQDLLAYLLEDPKTTAVLMYLESVVAGRELCRLIASSPKPVVVHKSNIAPGSNAIAQSHTSALANDEAVVEAALRNAGAIQAANPTQAMEIVKALAMPRPRGRRLAVISRSGGHAVVAADAAYRQGMELPPFPAAYLEMVQEATRASVIRLQNPLDLGDLFDFDVYTRAVEGALAMDQIDAVVLVHAYRDGETESSRKMVEAITRSIDRHAKPVGICLLVTDEERTFMSQKTGRPIFKFPDEAIMALRAAIPPEHRAHTPEISCAVNLDRERLKRIAGTAGDGGWLELPEALHLIAAAGVPVAPFTVVIDPEDAAQALSHLGGPVALKAVTPGASHKTESGGVVLNLQGEADIKAEAARMIEITGCQRLVVMKQFEGGRELMIGAKMDPAFGPVALLGLGGTEAELWRDTAISLAPVDDLQAGRMLDSLRSAPLFKGWRGRPPAHRASILEVMIRISHLAAMLPGFQELDINPLLCGPARSVAVDARVRVG